MITENIKEKVKILGERFYDRDTRKELMRLIRQALEKKEIS